jgi:hypothetical protein
MLTIKFDIMGKSGVLYSQSERSDFYGYKIVNISKWRSALYISQVVHIYMFLGYAHISWTIWLNFTQEIKKFLKRLEDELKLKI